jgi:hypothetical protein
MLWIVTVETTDSSGEHDRYEAIVLAHTDLAAKRVATTRVRALRGIETRIVSATQCDPYKTGVVALFETSQLLGGYQPGDDTINELLTGR